MQPFETSVLRTETRVALLSQSTKPEDRAGGRDLQNLPQTAGVWLGPVPAGSSPGVLPGRGWLWCRFLAPGEQGGLRCPIETLCLWQWHPPQLAAQQHWGWTAVLAAGVGPSRPGSKLFKYLWGCGLLWLCTSAVTCKTEITLLTHQKAVRNVDCEVLACCLLGFLPHTPDRQQQCLQSPTSPHPVFAHRA